MDSKLLRKVVQRVKAVTGIKAFLVLPVTALHPAAMSAVMLFYIANEGISIIENAAALGLPVPKKLT